MFASFVMLQSPAAAAAQHKELDLVAVILAASPVVKFILIVLALLSIACWFIVGAKLVRFRQATRVSRRFLDMFWSRDQGPQWTPERLETVYAQVSGFHGSPLAAVFHAGYIELARIIGQGAAQRASQAETYGDSENVERALRRASNGELTELESMLPMLATTGSTAPFIGLFGTVWGIMNVFISMHGQEKNLDVVLPGLAEALIATAIGLAAAIPAVMAYNYFVRRVRVFESELESFANDYLNIVRRHFLRA